MSDFQSTDAGTQCPCPGSQSEAKLALHGGNISPEFFACLLSLKPKLTRHELIKDPCTHTRARAVNKHVHDKTCGRAFTDRARVCMHGSL